MKEVGYSHLNLDNLFSVRDEVCNSRHKSSGNRKTGTKNCKKDKENFVSAQRASIVSSFNKCDVNNIDVLTPSITERSPFAAISNQRTFPISVNIEGKRTINLLNEELTPSVNCTPCSVNCIETGVKCISSHVQTEYDFTCHEEIMDHTENFVNAVPDGYATLGPHTECCDKCHAIMWKEERANKNVKHGVPKFSLCCGQGQIKLPCTPPTPPYLLNLYSDPKKNSETQTKKKRKRITMKEYYSYRLHVRKNEGLHVRLGGRLYQQKIILELASE
ncbi:hypothetical protein POM88_036207 [Heracleum sosnowskyi]|uniref:Uncharacterized protein n=1 Tax=Heracleum sosnowskyi TaxID=360622 RepID=A0AAD8HMR8_9APIA|nr:hypothetical protein POM88_036207 [Heracleum sosnowskyi]